MNNYRINTVISSIDNIERANAPLSFEIKLEAKIKNKLTEQAINMFSYKKQYLAIAALFAFLIINVYLMRLKSNESNSLSVQSTQQPSTIEGFNTEYQLINNSTY
jgi:hypothetical protein